MRVLVTGGRERTCTTCGALGDCGGTIAKCANCWEVEARLAAYVKSETGRDFIKAALAKEFAPRKRIGGGMHVRCEKHNAWYVSTCPACDEDSDPSSED